MGAEIGKIGCCNGATDEALLAEVEKLKIKYGTEAQFILAPSPEPLPH